MYKCVVCEYVSMYISYFYFTGTINYILSTDNIYYIFSLLIHDLKSHINYINMRVFSCNFKCIILYCLTEVFFGSENSSTISIITTRKKYQEHNICYYITILLANIYVLVSHLR